jgi:hypothetical protein
MRQARAEARMAELALEEREGSLVKKEDSDRAARRLASVIVQQFESIPDRIAAEFGADDEQRRKIRQRLRDEFDRLRSELASAGALAVQ